jgi:hypothetical protein
LAELYARFLLLSDVTPEEFEAAIDRWREQYGTDVVDEMAMKQDAIGYVDLLRDNLTEHSGSVLLLEQRVDPGIPECAGTADAVIVSASHVEVIDIKYGRGVRVEAIGNSQLRLYGVGGLEGFGDLLGDVKEVTYTVWQPRLDHLDSETMASVDLRAWRDSLIPIAEAALKPGAPYGPSENACRWCVMSGNCVAQVEYFTALDFSTTPETLTAEDLGELLPRLDGIEAWVNAVKASALKRAYNDEEAIPGFKVVMSNGKRFVSDEKGLIEALDMIGIDRDKYTTTKVVGIGELTKLGVIDTVKPFISKTDGKPCLAPEDDRRDSVNSHSGAALAFAEELTE